MQGIITKGVGGFYYVLSENKTYECRARGLFRLAGVKPVVGDAVEFSSHEQGMCSVEAVLPRTSVLKRPAVANVTHAAAVFSASVPAADLLLVDKLLVWARASGITPVVVVNKCDDTDAATVEELRAQYAPAADTFAISAAEGAGVDALRDYLRHKRTVLCGQSAAGKSTLMNALMPGIGRETGGLAKKTDRGKQTTRETELFIRDGLELVDSPGFFILNELPVEEPEALAVYYPEFADKRCYFAPCLHVSEPDCGVKAAVESGGINVHRYKRYVILTQEIRERKEHRYD